MESILKGPTTLAVLLGAEHFPHAPDLSKASFRRSNEQFRTYLIDKLGLDHDNVCDLFGATGWPGELLRTIESFIIERKAKAKATDLFVYYVGHGIERPEGFYMAISQTRKGKEPTESLSSEALRESLYSSGGGLQFYVILDCCFSAAAYRDFQDAPPKGATVLYASASMKELASGPDDEPYTRFSGAVFKALADGVTGNDQYLSFDQVHRRVEAIYRDQFGDEFVRPQLQSPNARQRDPLVLPVFPNPSYTQAPIHHEYFTTWIRRRGAPEGVGPIPPDIAKRLRSVTRMTRENGRVRRLDTVNGSGTLVAGYYDCALLSGSPEGRDGGSPECSREFSYSEDGRVGMEEVHDATGRLLYRCQYSGSAGADASAHYFLHPSVVARPRSQSGASFVKIVRDENGLDRRLEFFDGLAQRKPDDLGSYGREYRTGPLGLAVEDTHLGADLTPCVCKDGFAITRREHDLIGNIVSQSFFDARGKPVLHREGYHKAVFSWSPEGNLTGVALTGTDGQPVEAKAGFTSWQAAFDVRGNQTDLTYYGPDGNLIAIADGYARWIGEYDEHGRVHRCRFIDVAGDAACSKEGVWQYEYLYDERGNVSEVRCQDEGGNQIADKSNIARRLITTDDQGNVTGEDYFGSDDSPIRCDSGTAGYRTVFDSQGNATEIRHIGPDGQPSYDRLGIAQVCRSYDDRGRLTAEQYLDLHASPVEDAHGRHQISWTYAENPRRVTTSYFATDGTPAYVRGCASETAEYDDLGNVIVLTFHDGAGQPTRHASGAAREERAYDDVSRLVTRRYFGIDGRPVMTADGDAGVDTEYGERGDAVRRVFVNASGQPSAERPIETLSYNARGNCVLVEFRNAVGDLVLNTEGIAARQVEYDARGNAVRTAYRGTGGGGVRHAEGFAGWLGRYDRFSNRSVEEYFDETGAPCVRADGCARITLTYSPMQKKASEEFWDLQGSRHSLKYGYAGYYDEHDDRGHLVRQTFIGANGDPVDRDLGWACKKVVRDDRSREVSRDLFRVGGERVLTTEIAYHYDGTRTETTQGSVQTEVTTFDRAGHATSRAYFQNGGRSLHLEQDLEFWRIETDFDHYGRLIAKRYHDENGRLFRGESSTYDTVGGVTGTQIDELVNGGWRTTCTFLTGSGREVRVSLADAAGKPATDEFGRSSWTEWFDNRDNRIGIQYFDIAGASLAVHGHTGCRAKYDETDLLTEVVYDIPLEENELLTKRFVLPRDAPSHVHFRSGSAAGGAAEHDAYVLA